MKEENWLNVDGLTSAMEWKGMKFSLYSSEIVGECLLLFGAESFLFQFAIQKFKDQDI